MYVHVHNYIYNIHIYYHVYVYMHMNNVHTLYITTCTYIHIIMYTCTLYVKRQNVPEANKICYTENDRTIKVMHVHHYLRKMFITLVWNVQQYFYLHHCHIIVLPILFCVCQIQSIASLLSYSIIMY